jgi:hypothetical protein
MIEPELLERLRSVKSRVGLSEAEQIRQGIRWWLDSRDWPVRRAQHNPSSLAVETPPAHPPAGAQPKRKQKS